jgi:para-nitrobenzyl esterase
MMKRMRSAPRHLLAIAVVGVAVLTLSGCLLDPGAVPGIVNNAERRAVEVVTTSGPVAGVASPAGQAFLGIPYAAPPTGTLRWRAPQPPAPWTAVRDATRLGNICVQNLSFNPALGMAGGAPVVGEEDCLNLNVYAPANTVATSRLPVMVWIYGGGFVLGWSGQYDPSALAQNQDVIVVTINYRTGVFGFLAHPALDAESPARGGSGVFALLDQQLALRWVQGNIARFGGDPTRVTLFGESAGAFSACYQLASPGAAGLFQRAIMESGSCTSPVSVISAADANAGGQLVAEGLGCTDPVTAIACLRNKSVSALATAAADRLGLLGPNSWSPAYGNPVLPRRPVDAFANGTYNHMPVINGTNHDEGRLFTDLQNLAGNLVTTASYTSIIGNLFGAAAPQVLVAYPVQAYASPGIAYAAVLTDAVFACSARTFDRLLAPRTSVYAYEFNDPEAVTTIPQLPLSPPIPFTTPLHAYHASEIAYVFDTATILADPAGFAPEQKLLSQQMQTYWGSFARSGVPKASPIWPKYNPTVDIYQELQPTGTAPNNTFATDHKCAFWARLGF